MRISVVIPAYNAAKTIEKTVRNVLSSTIPLDVWVVDDGSTDGTDTCLEKLGGESRWTAEGSTLHVLRQPNQGAYMARLNALKRITTPYFGFVDADDTIEPDMFEKLLAVAEAENCDVVQCAVSGIPPSAIGQWYLNLKTSNPPNFQTSNPPLFSCPSDSFSCPGGGESRSDGPDMNRRCKLACKSANSGSDIARDSELAAPGFRVPAAGHLSSSTTPNYFLLSTRSDVESKFIRPHLVNGDGASFIWNKLYRNQYDFSKFVTFERLTNFDDMIFNFQFFDKVNRMAFIEDKLYHYAQTDGSSTHSYGPRQFEDFKFCAQFRKSRGISSYPWYWINLRSGLITVVRSSIPLLEKLKWMGTLVLSWR